MTAGSRVEMDYSVALCRGLDPDIFFERHNTPQILALCDTCPVQPACIRTHVSERVGIWGCSERARRKLRPLLSRNPDMTDVELMEIARRDPRGKPVPRVVAMQAMAKAESATAIQMLEDQGFTDRQISDMLGIDLPT